MTLYSAVDKAVITVWPRVQYYRDLGVLVVQDRNKVLEQERLTREAQEYLNAKNKEAAFRAYWTVPAQFSLIQVDVFGGNAETQAARAAVENIGRVFQWVKAADDVVDEQGGSRVGNLKNIYALLQRGRKPASGAEAYILEEYNRFDNAVQCRLDRVYQEELRQCNARNDKERYHARGEVGRSLGLLEGHIIQAHVEGLPDSITQFLELTGVGGAYFDDVKDFDLDRKSGYGYETNMRGKLCLGFVSDLAGAMRVLTPKQATRECAFLALGGLYQVREVIGVQERT